MSKKDPISELLAAINIQILAIAEDLKTTSIKIGDSDDKTYDRFLKTLSESKKIAENKDYLERLIKKREAGDDSEITDAPIGSIHSPFSLLAEKRAKNKK